MNRRSLLKRLGAAVLAAPVLAVVASRPAEASEADQARALTEDIHANPVKYPEIEALVAEKTGQRYRKGYDNGLRRGMQSQVEAYFNLEYMEHRVVASIDDKYVAAAREIKPNSIVPLMGDLVAISPGAFRVLPHQPGECADCDWYR